MTIEPEPARWPRGRTTPLPEAHRRFRQQLGLATDRPVVLSGHQAALWHAGIFAKAVAARTWAERIGGSAAWVVVDHDPEDFTSLRVPVRDAEERLCSGTVRIAGRAVANELAAGVPPARLPAFEPLSPLIERSALPELNDRLLRVVGSLREARTGARTAAEQLTGVLQRLCPGGMPGPIYATRMASTDLFASLVEKMRQEPRRCHEAYNAALAHAPAARLTPLRTPDGRIELPLWSLDPRTGVRRRVFADMIGASDHAFLAPRALLLSGVLRWAGCEVFIHGLGGGATGAVPGGYDRATEAWLAGWLGATLAPSVVVSATLVLPLSAGPEITPAQAVRTRWLAHAASHNPGLVGDRARAQRKAELVHAIDAAPRHGRERTALYAQLVALLNEHRAAHAPALAATTAAAQEARTAQREHAIAFDRTWSIGLMDPGSLRDLAARVRARLAE